MLLYKHLLHFSLKHCVYDDSLGCLMTDKTETRVFKEFDLILLQMGAEGGRGKDAPPLF